MAVVAALEPAACADLIPAVPAVGVGFRAHLARWLAGRPEEVECLEITAEHFFRDDRLERLRDLADAFPLVVHGLGLSLGSPGPLDRGELERFAKVVEVARPLWVSDHVGFRRTPEMDLGHFCPVAPTLENAALLAEHVREVAERCQRPVILENITSHLRLRGPLCETEFLNRVCELADCGLLLDVTNLFVNSHNHGYDPRAWLRDLDPQRVVQLHVVGYSYAEGCWHDRHREAIQEDLWELIADALAATRPRAVILERDDDFPHEAELAEELRRLKRALGPGASASASAAGTA